MPTPRILSGKEASQAILMRLAQRTAELVSQGQRPPSLVVVQVGEDPASAAYIRQKEKAAAQCGYVFHHEHLHRDTSEKDLARALLRYADDPGVDGMILQLPLDSSRIQDPQKVQALLTCIPAEKDADGLDTLNQGHLFTGESTSPHMSNSPYPIPATALGVLRLLEHSSISLEGKHAVVIGRSRLVGAPVAFLLLAKNATVTICHRHTQNLSSHTQKADLLIVAAGKKHLITPEHISPGCIAIDVGMHRESNGKLTGDVDPACYPHLAAYSPVPGGVGPMTVAGLMENTLNLRLMKED